MLTQELVEFSTIRMTRTFFSTETAIIPTPQYWGFNVATRASWTDKESDRPSHRARDVTILVVDNEPGVLKRPHQLLAAMRMTVLTAESVSDALQIIRTANVNVALIDWRLKGREDGLALGRALRRDYGIPFVLFSGYLDTDVTGHAYRAGAADVVDKPLRPGRLLAAVEFALRPHPPTETVPAGVQRGSDPVSRRLAGVMLRACCAHMDPNTESAVASEGGVSVSVFCKMCEACDVRARSARDLVRILRALSRSRETTSMVRTHLAVSDPRTRGRLFQRAGLPIDARSIPLRDFLLNQKFFSQTNECLRELAHLAANDPLFFLEFDRDGGALRDETSVNIKR